MLNVIGAETYAVIGVFRMIPLSFLTEIYRIGMNYKSKRWDLAAKTVK